MRKKYTFDFLENAENDIHKLENLNNEPKKEEEPSSGIIQNILNYSKSLKNFQHDQITFSFVIN